MIVIMVEDHALLSWDSGRRRWQRLVNERPVPDRKAQRTDRHETPVRARLVWERDGQEWFDTVCWAWTSHLVLVRVQDSRRGPVIGAWLSAEDVQRRA